MQNKISIVDFLGEEEVLAQLAEEASELAQAALKLRRALDGKNPTPKSVEECREALLEEVADVHTCLYASGLIKYRVFQRIREISHKKSYRWIWRLVNGCGERSGENG